MECGSMAGWVADVTLLNLSVGSWKSSYHTVMEQHNHQCPDCGARKIRHLDGYLFRSSAGWERRFMQLTGPHL